MSVRNQRDGSEEIPASIKKNRDRASSLSSLVPPIKADCSKKVYQKIIEAIQRYFSRQLLEPSFQSLVSLIDQDINNNPYYLLELLHNAIDNGAMHILLKSKVIIHSP